MPLYEQHLDTSFAVAQHTLGNVQKCIAYKIAKKQLIIEHSVEVCKIGFEDK